MIALRTATTVVAGTRPAILVAGYLAVLMFGYQPGGPPVRDFDNELLNLPFRWDARWYLQIAKSGYSFNPQAGPEVQQNVVFFPAYPLAVRAIALPLGNGPSAYALAGTLFSLVAFWLALAYLYLLAREELGDDESGTALWLLATYPFALFYGAIYTESLYLLGVAGAFYHFRKRELARAGAWGFVVGLTRPNGFFLCVPLALVAIERWLPPLLAGGWTPRPATARARGKEQPALTSLFAAAAMPVVGMLLYSAFIWSLTGSPFTWASGHLAWGRHYQGLARIVTDRYDFIWHVGFSGYLAQVPQDLLNAIGVLFVLATVWPVWRRLGLPYAVFILINVLAPLAAGGLMSAGRLSSVLFPAFVWLAAAVPARHRTGWIATFMAFQAFNASLFYTWRLLY